MDAYRGNIASASRGLEEAIEILDALGQKQVLSVALCNLGELNVWQGRLSEARQRGERALEIARELDYGIGRAAALRVIGEALMEIGEQEAARVNFERALKMATQLNLLSTMVASRYSLARMALEAGEAEQTEAHITVARGIASRRDPESYLTALVALQAWVCAYTGDEADATRMLNVALASLDKLPTPRRCHVMLKAARAHVVMGNRDEGLRLAAKAAGMAASRGLQPRILRRGSFWRLRRMMPMRPKGGSKKQPSSEVGWCLGLTRSPRRASGFGTKSSSERGLLHQALKVSSQGGGLLEIHIDQGAGVAALGVPADVPIGICAFLE